MNTKNFVPHKTLSMIFKTLKNELDNITNKLNSSAGSIHKWSNQAKKSFNDAANSLNGFNGELAGASESSQKSIKLISKNDFTTVFKGLTAEDFFDNFNQSGSESVSTLTRFCEKFKNMDDTMHEYLTECMQKQVPASFEGYNKYVQKATANTEKLTTSTKVANLAFKGLKLLGSALLSKGISMAIEGLFTLFDNLIHAEEKALKKAQETANKSREIATAHTEERTRLSELISKYEELAQSEDYDSETRIEIKGIQEEIIGLVGNEAEGIDLINGKLNEEINKLRTINALKAGETVSDYENAYKDANNETKKTVIHEGNWIHNLVDSGNNDVITFDFWGDDNNRNKGLKIIDKVWKEKNYGTAYVDIVNGIFGIGDDTYSRLSFNRNLTDSEKAEAIRVAIEALENTEGYDYNDSKLWKKLVEIRNSLTGTEGNITKQKEAANILLDAILVETVGSGKNVSSLDEYNNYIDEIVKNISENSTIKEAIENGDLNLDYITSMVNNYLGGMKKFSIYTEDLDKTVNTLTKLKNTSNVLSNVSKAFKELSDNGYITINTISDIQEATGLSGDAWKEYQDKLMNAESGSQEFKQILSELTYKILENQLGTEGLTNATEEQISAILRENGILYTEENAIKDLSKAYKELNLAIEAVDRAGILNRLGLDQEELKEIKSIEEFQKLLNSKEYKGYYGTERNRMSQSDKEHYDADIQATLGLLEQFWSIQEILNSFKYTSFNEALNNALSNAEKSYKIHQNELSYISELQNAYDTLAQTEEERLDIEEKIEQARKDYANNRISDIEHEIQLKKNSEGENADVTKYYDDIQKIAHAEAERLRNLGYKENSSEIQELQNKWWAAKQAIDAYNESLEESRKNDFNTRIGNYEHDIFLLEKNGGNNQEIIDTYRKMQDEIHNEAQYYRSLDIDENDERIQELQKQWWGYQDNIEEVKNNIIADINETVTEVNELLDGFQNVYTTLADVAKEYNTNGYLSTDSLQSILELGPKYLDYLYDENGQLVVNKQALENIIAAQTERMAVEQAYAYAKQILAAAEANDVQALTNLTQVTTESSDATWDMA